MLHDTVAGMVEGNPYDSNCLPIFCLPVPTTWLCPRNRLPVSITWLFPTVSTMLTIYPLLIPECDFEMIAPQENSSQVFY